MTAADLYVSAWTVSAFALAVAAFLNLIGSI